VFRNLSDADMARLVESEAVLAQAQGATPGEEAGERLPLATGVDLAVEWVRDYPSNLLASHMVGYVGRSDPAQATNSEPFDYALAEWAGRTGVERSFDPELRGEPGREVVRIDAAGYRFVRDRAAGPEARAEWRRESVAGQDVRLAADVHVQAAAEQALEGATGAVVVVDPANGDVLAMASAPGFDPNELAAGLAAEQWQALQSDPRKPLNPRAHWGLYAPGSAFKPVTALAALEAGRATPQLTFTCPGYFLLGRARFECWENRAGHGPQNLAQALQHSCNVYFFNLGLRCGPQAIHDMALQFGFGRLTGIDLGGEKAGLVPDDAWKRQHQHDGGRDGDTCNLSIGQGALLVTPLQMATFAMALANGGRLYQPRLVLEVRDAAGRPLRALAPRLVRTLAVAPAHLRLVREALRAVIESPTGTGRKAAVEGFPAAGKTGTAEHGAKGSGQKWTWMIAFAPYDHPRYALAMLVEEGVSGGSTVAPLVHDLLDDLLAKPGRLQGEG